MATGAAPVAAARRVAAGRGWQWNVDAWTLTAGQRALFVVLSVALLLLAGVLSAMPLVGPFAGALVLPPLIGGLVLGCDALRRREPLRLDHLFAGFEPGSRGLLALGTVFAVANAVLALLGEAIAGPDVDALTATLPGVLLGGGLPDVALVRDVLMRELLAMLVVLALSLPLLMALWFAIPLVALQRVPVGAALKASFAACAENVLPFVVWSVPPLALTLVLMLPLAAAILFRSLGLGLLAVPALCLDFVLTAALTFASLYTSYRDVFALGDLP